MPELLGIAVIAAIVWVLSLAIATGGYLVGRRGLSRLKAVLGVILVSAIPALVTFAIVSTISHIRSNSESTVGSSLPSNGAAASLGGGGGGGGGASNDIDGRLQQAVDNLPLGDVLFHHPEEMQLRKQETVQVRISQDQKADLSRGLSAQGVTERDRIKISSSMKVRLSGDANFDVKPLADEEQLVTRRDYTEWSFTVVPLKRGRWPLHLVVTAVIRTPWGTEKYKDYPVKDEFVQVQVTPFHATEYFVEDNWQWILTAILIPLAAWMWKWRAGAKRKKVAAVKFRATMASVRPSAAAPDGMPAPTVQPKEQKSQPKGAKSA